MKTIKIDEESFILLNEYKYHKGKKSYSDTIKHMHELIQDLIHYRILYLKEHEK